MQLDLLAPAPVSTNCGIAQLRMTELRGPFCYGCLRYAPLACAPGDVCPRCKDRLLIAVPEMSR